MWNSKRMLKIIMKLKNEVEKYDEIQSKVSTLLIQIIRNKRRSLITWWGNRFITKFIRYFFQNIEQIVNGVLFISLNRFFNSKIWYCWLWFKLLFPRPPIVFVKRSLQYKSYGKIGQNRRKIVKIGLGNSTFTIENRN